MTIGNGGQIARYFLTEVWGYITVGDGDGVVMQI